MGGEGLVSVIIGFLNTERFLEEAIESVLDQSYDHWELLLVDDGSTDRSTHIARAHAKTHGRIRYLDHPNHEYRGISAPRNLGIRHANGSFVAFIDSDDVWLAGKLERQMAIMASRPEAAMVYGINRYWRSWSGDHGADGRDFGMPHGIPSNRLMGLPRLLVLHLSGKAAVPCTSSVLARRVVVLRVGGFEDAFPGLYEDQVFYAKLCLDHPVFVSSDCDDLYRQHPESITATTSGTRVEREARRRYLHWLAGYLHRRAVADQDLWQALARQIWLTRTSDRLSASPRLLTLQRRVKRQLLRVEEHLLPARWRRWIWTRKAWVPGVAPDQIDPTPGRR
jgi:glycosyltransferase involved in cell wall biosynthesis